MDNLVIVGALVAITVVVIAIGLRLRTTGTVGAAGAVDRGEDHARRRLSIGSAVTGKLTSGSVGKPVLSISMRTTRREGGEPSSTETITIDGQTYGSIEDIPPEVRDRVRALLARARRPGSDALDGADAALLRIESDLAALGLELHDSTQAPEEPPKGV